MASISKNQQVTPRQLEVLAAISRFEGRQCYSPTIAELAGELNVSRTTVFEHIAGLRGKKLLTVSKGRARSSKLTAKARRLLEEYQGSEDASASNNFGGINLLGRVAAGRPIEAIQDRQSLSLGDLFGTADDVFALEVVGDSMIEEGIDSGDYVVCKRSQTAGDGELVVAIMDEEEVTLKRFYLEKDRVRLQPANEAYDPIYSNNCKIEAVVIGLLHHY